MKKIVIIAILAIAVSITGIIVASNTKDTTPTQEVEDTEPIVVPTTESTEATEATEATEDEEPTTVSEDDGHFHVKEYNDVPEHSSEELDEIEKDYDENAAPNYDLTEGTDTESDYLEKKTVIIDGEEHTVYIK